MLQARPLGKLNRVVLVRLPGLQRPKTPASIVNAVNHVNHVNHVAVIVRYCPLRPSSSSRQNRVDNLKIASWTKRTM